jgi:hypothetical protein
MVPDIFIRSESIGLFEEIACFTHRPSSIAIDRSTLQQYCITVHVNLNRRYDSRYRLPTHQLVLLRMHCIWIEKTHFTIARTDNHLVIYSSG